MKTKLFFSTLTMAAAMAVAPAVFADEASVDYNYSIEYQRGSYKESSFTGIGITVDGKVESFTLTGSEGSAISSQSVVFIGDGDGDSVTVTTANIDNGTFVSGHDSTTDVFAVEGCTVILDGLEINDLGMNLTIGTMYGVGDAELVITNSSNIVTGADLNTVGSNLATGTITIEDGSTLATQQITLGGGVSTLFAGSEANGQYQTKWFVDDDTYTKIRDTLVSGEYEGSYGIVNVKSGSTFSVGVSDTDHSVDKFQLSNGELNVDGEGSQMIIGSNSEFLLMGENGFSNSTASAELPLYTGMYSTEKITVTNGGKITNEAGTTLYALYLGEDFISSNTTVEISVSGKDDSDNASTFDLASANSVHIGTKSGYDTNFVSYGESYIIKDGGTMNVTIKAEDGGVFKITADDGVYVCADNYATYLDEEEYDYVGHSEGIDVSLSATNGGSLELNAEKGSTVLLAAGSPLEGDYKNTLTVTADGEGSSVTISGGDIYTNYGDDGTGGASSVSVEISAKDGGTIALKAATVEDTGTGTISLGTNTTVTVENGSSLTTEGTVVFNAGASASVDATSTWATGATDAITFASGSSLTISIGADAVTPLANTTANVSLGVVTIAEGGSVYVVIDVSSLEAGESATVAVLSAESVTLNTTALTDGDVTSIAAGYFTADEKGYTLNSWTWSESDKTLYANVTATPEPSMFGLLFGLGALGLTATRRRRRA